MVRKERKKEKEKERKRTELKEVTKEKTNRVPLGVEIGERDGSLVRRPR